MTTLALLTALAAQALHPDYYASSSSLASGRWVKIKVGQAGMQQITAEELAAAGFSDPERVGVYGFSSVDISDHNLTDAKPDDLPAIPSICTEDGKLIFYAENGERCGVGFNSSGNVTPAFRQNPSSREGYYFLHETEAPLRPRLDNVRPVGNKPSNSYLTLLMHKYMDRYHTGAGAIILSDNIVKLPARKLTHTFDVLRPDPSRFPTYHISYAAYSADNNAKLSVSYPNGIYTYTFTGTATTLFTRAYTNSSTIGKLESDCTSAVSLTARTDNLDFAAINYVAMLYYRLGDFVDDQSQMSFYTSGALNTGQQFRFTNVDASAPLEVWDLTTASMPVRLPVTADTETSAIAVNKTVRADGTLSRFIAFKPSLQLNSVEIIGEADNSDLHSSPTPDLVIITTPGLRPQAERLAELHRTYQNMDVMVADHLSIFNEFSSGTPSADALRRFVKMLYDRDPGKLRHLLLLGTSYVNPRGIDTSVCPDIATYIPTFPTEDVSCQFNEAKAYSADSFFGIMADGSMSPLTSAMDINVGRIPACDAAEAAAYIDKAERYLTHPAESDVRSRVISISDRGNSSGHTLQAIEAGDLITHLAPGTHIFRDYDPVYFYTNNDPKIHNTVIADQLQTGVGFLTYCGHGNEISIGSAPLWGRRNITSTRVADPPFVMLATCDSYPFDLGRHGLGHSFILSPDAGAIAMIASCREVQMSLNQRLHLAVIREYFAEETPATMGDIYRLAHNRMKAEESEIHVINTLCYSFAGDPALPLYSYTHSIEPESSAVTLTPHSADNRIAGTVNRADGTPDTDFDGTLIADLYTPPYATKTYFHASSDTLRQVTLDGDHLTTVKARVTAGRFDFNLDMPNVITPGSGFELHLAALRDGSHDRAAITLRDVTVGDSESDEPIQDNPPVITDFSVETSADSDGTVTDTTPAIRAEWITPYTISHRGVASTSYLEIDGRRIPLRGIASSESDETGSLYYTPGPLADGLHTARLYIADNAGRAAEASLHFTVVSTSATASLCVDRPVASGSVAIDLTHDFPGLPSGRLVIIDRSGNTVMSVTDPSFPFDWDCCDSNGKRVPDGRYTIRAWLRRDKTLCEAAPTEIVVIE
ncbi:MAG: hypothetical protein K2I64_03630 [Muribaculaceae bacterium]|nr:hypothetical protein [Muribaculaceae bacterium]